MDLPTTSGKHSLNIQEEDSDANLNENLQDEVLLACITKPLTSPKASTQERILEETKLSASEAENEEPSEDQSPSLSEVKNSKTLQEDDLIQSELLISTTQKGQMDLSTTSDKHSLNLQEENSDANLNENLQDEVLLPPTTKPLTSPKERTQERILEETKLSASEENEGTSKDQSPSLSEVNRSKTIQEDDLIQSELMISTTQKATSEEESGAQQPSRSGYRSSSLSVVESLKRSNTELQQSSASELVTSTLEEIKVSGGEGNKQAIEYQAPIPSATKKFKWTNPKQQDSKADIISTKSTRQVILSTSSDEQFFNIQEHGPEENLQEKNQLPSTMEYESSLLLKKRSLKLLPEKTMLKAKEKIEVLLQIVNGEFPGWKSFELFALSTKGLDMDWADIVRFRANVDSDHTRKKINLQKWMQQEDATAELLIDRVKKYKEQIEEFLQIVNGEFPGWKSFELFASSTDGLAVYWDVIEQIDEDVPSDHTRKKLFLQEWMQQEEGATTKLLIDKVEKYKEQVLQGVINGLSNWTSFKKFANSSDGLNLSLIDINRMEENIDSVYEREKLILKKWMEQDNRAVDDLWDRYNSHSGGIRRYEFNLNIFIPFALSTNGLCLIESDVYEIINNDKDDAFYQIWNEWEEINGRELSEEVLRKFIDKYEYAVLLTKAQDFLSDVEEFKKFALSHDGLGLGESDVHDIIEDDSNLNQKKIDRMKEKWTTKKGNSKKGDFDGVRFDDCMIRYCREYCIITSMGEWDLWIPGFKERYTHQETHPIHGEMLRGESYIPISTRFFDPNDGNMARARKLKNLKKHNNVVPCVQLNSYEGYYYIVTERQSTETLEDVYYDLFDKKLSIDLCLQLLQGLNFLHENDIAHCNLTPQTIFVSKDRRNLKLSSYHAILPSDDDLLHDDIYNAPEYVSNKTISDKMNIYTAGKIITKILTNGRYPESQIRPESIPDIDQPKLDAKYLPVSNKLLLQELIQQLCNPDPDSRPTSLEALGDFTFYACSVNLGKLEVDETVIRCTTISHTQHDQMTSQWKRDKGRKLKEQVCRTSNGSQTTDFNIMRAGVHNRPFSDQDLLEIQEKFWLKEAYQDSIVEFCDCSITKEHLELFRNLCKYVNWKCGSFVVSYTDNIAEIIEIICDIVIKQQISRLSLEYDDLDDNAVDLIQSCFQVIINQKNEIWKKEYVFEHLEELNISYSKNISPVGYKTIGEMFRKFKIETLIAVDCDITDEKLEEFLTHLGDTKLNELDISCNKGLTTKGFALLSNFIAKNVSTSVRMSGCCLSDESISVLQEQLSTGNSRQMLEQLDLSYNSTITPNASLGSIIVKCGITKLNLAGCRLNEKHLTHMRESTSQQKMYAVSMRDNFTIGDGLVEIAELVKQTQLKELDISNCAFSACELKSFREKLGEAELQRLYLGDKERECDVQYMDEICNFFPNVADTLHLQFHRINEASRYILRKRLQECVVLIQLSEDSTERWTMQYQYK